MPMKEQAAEYYYPNLLARILLQAMEEILGNSELNAVLNKARLSQQYQEFPPKNLDREIPYPHISQMLSSLEEIYGEREGQGLAVRSGRACFKYGLREFGQQNILSDPGFRLLPLGAKIRQGGKIFAGTFNELTDQRVWVNEDETHFYWYMDNCPLCWQRHTQTPACHMAVGTLQEALIWISGGKVYNVEEIECIAKGDPACKICIDKVPFE